MGYVSFPGLMLVFMILGPIGLVAGIVDGRWLAALVFAAVTVVGVLGWRVRGRD